jgi:hypothetical protein
VEGGGFFDIRRLGEMNTEVTLRFIRPLEVDPEEVRRDAKEADREKGRENAFKLAFDLRVGREVDEVINVKPDVKRCPSWDDCSREETGRCRWGGKAHGFESRFYGLVPQFGRTAEAI